LNDEQIEEKKRGTISDRMAPEKTLTKKIAGT